MARDAIRCGHASRGVQPRDRGPGRGRARGAVDGHRRGRRRGGHQRPARRDRARADDPPDRRGCGPARAKLDRRAKALGGAYAFVAGALSRLVSNPEASTENVTLFTGELRYLRPIEERAVSLGVGLIGADAQPITEEVGARTFRNLGADGLLVLDGGPGAEKTKHLTLGFGIRDFTYKENRDFDWIGPVATRASTSRCGSRRAAPGASSSRRTPVREPLLRLDRAGERVPAGCAAQRQLLGRDVAAGGAIECSASASRSRGPARSSPPPATAHRDRLQQLRPVPAPPQGDDLGDALASARPLWHRARDAPDRSVPRRPRAQTDTQRSEFTSLDDENRSSLQIRIGREVSTACRSRARRDLAQPRRRDGVVIPPRLHLCGCSVFALTSTTFAH